MMINKDDATRIANVDRYTVKSDNVVAIRIPVKFDDEQQFVVEGTLNLSGLMPSERARYCTMHFCANTLKQSFKDRAIKGCDLNGLLDIGELDVAKFLEEKELEKKNRKPVEKDPVKAAENAVAKMTPEQLEAFKALVNAA